jgi:hypothetical protein
MVVLIGGFVGDARILCPHDRSLCLSCQQSKQMPLAGTLYLIGTQLARVQPSLLLRTHVLDPFWKPGCSAWALADRRNCCWMVLVYKSLHDS